MKKQNLTNGAKQLVHKRVGLKAAEKINNK